jgi:hypothetical protein
MSKNLRVIDQLSNEFYRANWPGIAELVTPTFKFKSPASADLNFEQYCIYMDHIFAHVEISNPKIFDQGDENLHVEFSMGLINSKKAMRLDVPCKVDMVIIEEKIDLLIIGYDQKLLNRQQLEKYTS